MKKPVNKTELKRYLQFWFDFNIDHMQNAGDDRHLSGFHGGQLRMIVNQAEYFAVFTPKQIAAMKKKMEQTLGRPARKTEPATRRPKAKRAARNAVGRPRKTARKTPKKAVRKKRV